MYVLTHNEETLPSVMPSEALNPQSTSGQLVQARFGVADVPSFDELVVSSREDDATARRDRTRSNVATVPVEHDVREGIA